MDVRSSDYNEDNFAEGEKKKKKKKKKKSSKKKIQDTRLCLLRVEKEKKVKTARELFNFFSSLSPSFFLCGAKLGHFFFAEREKKTHHRRQNKTKYNISHANRMNADIAARVRILDDDDDDALARFFRSFFFHKKSARKVSRGVFPLSSHFSV